MHLVSFKAISTFTTELGTLYSKQQRSLKLYCRLINKTTVAHDTSIQKHIDAFKIFCVTNREAIVTKSANKIVMSKISYSQRVFIDMSNIFKLSDNDTSKIIWDHLLCISALVDPGGKAKELLKKNMESGKVGELETTFLTDIINKVEQHVDPHANPMEAVSSIIKSGIFTDLVGGMNDGLSNGTLDLGKIMGAVQEMVGQLNEGDNSQPDNTLNMITSLMGNMGGGTNQPDIASMMQGIMGNMGGGGGTNQPDIASMMQGIMKGLVPQPDLQIKEIKE
jgi:hypothetical protein